MYKSRRKKSVEKHIVNKMIHFNTCSFWYKDLHFIQERENENVCQVMDTVITLKDFTEFVIPYSAKKYVVLDMNYQLTGIWNDNV